MTFPVSGLFGQNDAYKLDLVTQSHVDNNLVLFRSITLSLARVPLLTVSIGQDTNTRSSS